MRFQLALLASAALLGLTLSAHATTITYTLANAAVAQGSITGTVTINSANNQITSASLTFHDTALGNPVFNQVNPNSGGNYADAYITNAVGSSTTGQIFLDYSTISSGGNLNICTTSFACSGSNGTSYVQIYNMAFNSYNPASFTAGTLSAPTPEPSSLVLLGTGVLGLVGAARRRLQKV